MSVPCMVALVCILQEENEMNTIDLKIVDL